MPAASSERQAIVALVVLTLLWGLTWPVMKDGLRFAGPFDFAALRGLPAAAVLFAAMLVLRRPFAPVVPRQLALLGLFQTAAFNLLVSLALVAGAAGKTSVLVYTFPFWTIIFARIGLGERMQVLQWAAVAIAASGLVLVVEPWNLAGSLASSAFAVAAGACWALASVYAKKLRAQHDLDLLSLSAWQTLFGGIVLAVAAMLVPSPPVVWTAHFVGLLSYSIFLGTAAGWFLWMYVLKRLPAGIAGLGMLSVPALGVLLSRITLGEKPRAVELAGMALIAIALGLLSWASSRPAVQPSPAAPLTAETLPPR